MRKYSLIGILSCILLISILTALNGQNNLMIGQVAYENIPDSDFENQGAWVFTGSAGLTNNPNAPSGTKVLYIRGQSRADQTINVPNAGCYRFEIKATQASPTGNNGFRILINGTETLEVIPDNNGFSSYFSVAFTLVAGNHDISIVGSQATSFAVLLDDIQLANLPCWADDNNWSQSSVPNATDTALIRNGGIVVLNKDALCHTIKAEGMVLAANNQSLDLDADIIRLMGPGALMEWGQANTPYEQIGVITLHGDSTTAADEDQSAALMAMQGGELQLHGQPRDSWTQLGATANRDDRQIKLKEAMDWKVGDEIVIASTDFDPYQAETRVITQVSSGGTTFSFVDSLIYDHYGVIQTFPASPVVSELDERAEVGLLTRNLKVQGDSDSEIDKIGGHIMIMEGSFAQISGVELYNMGQEGILGRYPFHWHLTGDLTDQYIKNSSINVSFNRVLTVHSSSNGLIEDNVAYDHIGNGYFLENGDETNNRFIGNLGILTRAAKIGKEVQVYDRFPTNGGPNFKLPATFWITHPSNDFIGNASGGSAGSGFWMTVQHKPIEEDTPSGITPRFEPLGVFENNSSHSTGFSNFAIDLHVVLEDSVHVLKESGTYKPPSTPIVSGFTSFKCRDRAFWMRTESLDFDSCAMGDNGKSSFFSYHNVIRNSLYVGKSDNIGTSEFWTPIEMAAGRSVPDPIRGGTVNIFKGHPLYDGPSGIENCHFANFYGEDAVIFNPNTAATKSTVHFAQQLSFTNVPTANKVSQLFEKDKDFQWTTGLIDLDGSLDALTNPGDVIKPRIFPKDNPDRRLYDEGFNVEVGAQYVPEWEHYICPNEHYGLLLLTYDWPDSRKIPMYSIRSDGPATITEGQDVKNQIPVIVNNEDYRYYLQYHRMMDSLFFRLKFLSQNDVATFVLLNVPSNLAFSKPGGSVNPFNSLADFENSNDEGYYYDNNTVYIRLKGTGLHNVKQFGDEFPYTSTLQICRDLNCTDFTEGGTFEMPLADYQTGLDERGSLSTSGNLTVGNIVYSTNGANSFSITSDGDGLDEYIEYRLNFHRQVWSEFNNLELDFLGPELEVLLHDQSEGEVPLGFYQSTSCYGLDLTRLSKAEIDQVDALILRVRESSLGDLNQSGLNALVQLNEIALDYARDLWDFHRDEEGWSGNGDATISASSGLLQYDQASSSANMGNDLFSGKPAVNPEENPEVVVRMKVGNSGASVARFYHYPWSIGWIGTDFNLNNDGQFHNYIVPVNWNNNFDIQRVRLDPLLGAGAGDCEVDFIRFTPCSDCYNEVQDIANGETGIDCGGPNCVPCPCEDGIQNNGEMGIDCGGPCQPCSKLVFENDVLLNVSDNWLTVNTVNTYSNMVVIATPEVVSVIASNPVVTRIRNITSNSFEIRLQTPGGGATGTHKVHYFAIEEGTYTEAIDGINMEAWTESSTATARKGNWVMETRSLSNTYTNPVILGQVQSYNDPLWSVFWASKMGQRNAPPEGGISNFSGGKHIGEDNQFIRSDETISLLAIEAGLYELDGQIIGVGLGQDNIFGVQNAVNNPPIPYVLSNQIDIEGAVLSSAAMDGGDGGWPILYSGSPIQGNSILLAVDEDRIGDFERSHTSEQVAYLAFGDHASASASSRNHSNLHLTDSPSNPFTLFPNPLVSGQRFTLAWEEDFVFDPAALSLLAVDGRKVPLNIEERLDRSIRVYADLVPGIYFVSINTPDKRLFQKLVVAGSLNRN